MIDVQDRPGTAVDTAAVAGSATERLCLPGAGLTLTETLRVLDVLRRRLARNTRGGQEGAFAGFDVLDASRWRPEAEEAHILFTARRVADDPKGQVVPYAATACAHGDGLCTGDAAGQVLVQGTGTTVCLARTAAAASDPRRFTIAPPHR